jgi:hypothetical protein
MSHENVIDIDKEFSLLTELVNGLWDGVDTGAAKIALRLSFMQGLQDAKLWIDPNATFRIAKILNGNDEIAYPISKRRKFDFNGDKFTSLYDALCTFDSNLSDGLSKIDRSVTAYKRWDYSSNADKICNYLGRTLDDIHVTPKNEDECLQNTMAESYIGYHACEAGSFSTPKKLVKSYVDYSREEQGLSYLRSLFSAVYSHGLYCAKIKNTQTLVNDLLPIYAKRDEPINFDNGGEILAEAIKNPFVAIIHKMQPFAFSSTEIYMEEARQSKESAVSAENMRASETTEQKKKRLDAYFSDMDKRIEEDDNKTNAFIDKISLSIKGYKLAL